MKTKPSLRHFLVLAASLPLAAPSAHAADGTWNVDADGLWNTSTNWLSDSIADGPGSSANFTNDITDDRTVSLDGDFTVTNVVFGDSDTGTAGSWTLNNNSTAGNNLILDGATPTFTVNALGAGKTVHISAVIQSTTGLVKDGAGTLILSGGMTSGNGYSSSSINTINAGTLQIGNGGAGGFLGGTFVNNASLAINRTGGAPGVGAISGTGSVTLTSGTGLVLNASNSYEGGFNYNGGSLTAFAAGTFTGFGTGTLTINSGAGGFQMATGSPTVTLTNNIQWNKATTNFTRLTSGTPTVDFNGDVTLGQSTTLNINSSGYAIHFVFDGNIGDGGSGFGLSMTGGNGASSLTLNGANTYTGVTTVSIGTVKLGASGSLAAAGSVSIAAGATFDLTEKTAASATYTWNTSSLSASGAATPATISGTAGGTIDMGSKPISLSTNGTNPSLTVTGATLALGGNPFTVVVPGPALTAGVYTLVSADSITGTVNPTASYTGGNGLAGGTTGLVSISGNNVILTVTGSSSPYETWAATNAGGQGPELDYDNDGVRNGVEFFMNAAEGFTANPQLNASNTITWTNGGNIPASAYGTQFMVQTSPDLSVWTNVQFDDPNLVNTDGSLTYTLTGGSPRFVRLSVTPN